MIARLQVRYEQVAPDDYSGGLFDGDGICVCAHVHHGTGATSLEELGRNLTEDFGHAEFLADRFPDGFTVTWKNGLDDDDASR